MIGGHLRHRFTRLAGLTGGQHGACLIGQRAGARSIGKIGSDGIHPPPLRRFRRHLHPPPRSPQVLTGHQRRAKAHFIEVTHINQPVRRFLAICSLGRVGLDRDEVLFVAHTAAGALVGQASTP